MIVTFDTWAPASLDTPLTGQKRQNVGVFVEGIDLTGVSGDKRQALWVARQGIINQLGGNLSITNHPEMTLQRIVLNPVSDDDAAGVLIYESFASGNPPSSYLLEDGSTMQAYQTTQLPGTREDIYGSWKPSGDVAPIPRRPILMKLERPIRWVTVTALTYGRPNRGQNFMGFVNAAEWPSATGSFVFNGGGGQLSGTQGMPGSTWGTDSDQTIEPLPRAHWRLDEYRTTYSKYAGYFNLAAKASTKITEDWSEYFLAHDGTTGRYAEPDEGQKIAMLAQPYQYGVMRINGAVRVGPADLANFYSIFGF